MGKSPSENVMATVSSIIGVIPDPRRGNHLKHAAHDMLFAAVVAVMCGYDSYRLFSSLPVDPALALKATRRHWGVESMHWTPDVTFGEDYCRARREHAAKNRATARRIALNLLRRYGRSHKCGTKTAMMLANQLEGALDEMLAA